MRNKLLVSVYPNAFIARVAAFRLKEESVAVTFGQRIFLYGTDKEKFLADKRWLCHELAHVEQFQKFGCIRFIFLYLKESLANGYLNNRFEAEARERESDESLLKKFHVI